MFYLFIVFPVHSAYCQKTGKVEVLAQDARINSLVNKHITFNEKRETISGFRIQIFFDSGNNSKSRAVDAMNAFKAKYSKVGAYLTFQEPNYRIRVGDFRSRMDAQRFLHKITDAYPNAFIVKDNEINYPSLDDEYDDKL
jgi:hypothetical protein